MLYTFYYLVCNTNIVLSFESFLEVWPTYDFNNNIAVSIHRLRSFLEENGYVIISHKSIGYECIKIWRYPHEDNHTDSTACDSRRAQC